MKHIKIKSSEVLHGGKTLDKVLGENKQEDIPTLVFEGNTSLDLYTKYLSEVVKLIYNEVKFIKFECASGNNITPSQNGGKANIHINTFVTEGSNGSAPGPVLTLACSALGAGGITNLFSVTDQLTPVQITNGNADSERAWTTIYNISSKDIFEAAGLTVEDFLRKFVPDSPYLE